MKAWEGGWGIFSTKKIDGVVKLVERGSLGQPCQGYSYFTFSNIHNLGNPEWFRKPELYEEENLYELKISNCCPTTHDE